MNFHNDHIIKGLTGEICCWETESSGGCFEPVVQCLGEELGGWKIFPKDQGLWQRSDCRSQGSCIWLRTDFMFWKPEEKAIGVTFYITSEKPFNSSSFDDVLLEYIFHTSGDLETSSSFF